MPLTNCYAARARDSLIEPSLINEDTFQLEQSVGLRMELLLVLWATSGLIARSKVAKSIQKRVDPIFLSISR